MTEATATTEVEHVTDNNATIIGTQPMARAVRKVSLKAAWLVVHHLSVKGCTHYSIRNRQETQDGVQLNGEWHTNKHVDDINEQKAAFNVNCLAAARIRRVGYSTGAGVFVAASQREELEAAIREAHRIVDAHNRTAHFTHVNAEFLVFPINAENTDAAKLVYREARTALENLNKAIAATDVKQIRKVLQSTKGLSELFPESCGQKMSTALKQAQMLACKINKAADNKAAVLEQFAQELQTVETARVMFTEFDGLETGEDVYIPAVDARQVEME